MNEITRYSDAELDLFKIRIEQMIEKETINLQYLVDQITEIGENGAEVGDWMDGSSSSTSKEMLNTMESRQRKHLWDLEKALVRIKNKTYGICIVTGEKIDTKRLMAVPTTTKSLAAKTGGVAPVVVKRSSAEMGASMGLKSREIVSRIGANVNGGNVRSTDKGERALDKDEDEDLFEEDTYVDELDGEDFEDSSDT